MPYKNHPEVSPGYDPVAFTASIKHHITKGSQWSHKNGNTYTVLTLTNMESDDHYRYPPMVVYQGENGHIWSRKASDWDRSMTKLNKKKSKVGILVAGLSLLLGGCWHDLNSGDYEQAQVRCVPNGGVSSLTVYESKIAAVCNNEARFVFLKEGYTDNR